MNTIDSFTFISMTGQIPSYAQRVIEETRPGVDGHIFRKLGKRGGRFTLTTRSTHVDFETAELAKFDYEQLQSNFVNIEKAGQILSKIMVHSVSTELQPLLVSTDGNTWMIIAQWELQRGE